MPRYKHRVQGFTAIELMVTVAVLAILAAVAAPSFNPLIERWRVRQVSEELQSTLYFARSEAVKRSGGITILRNGDTGDCVAVGSDTSLWSCGWIVFADTNNDGVQDSGEDTLQQVSAPTKVSVKFTDSSNADLSGPIHVDRWGQLSSGTAANFAFRLMPQGRSGNQASASSLCVSSGGRIRRLDSGDASCA